MAQALISLLMIVTPEHSFAQDENRVEEKPPKDEKAEKEEEKGDKAEDPEGLKIWRIKLEGCGEVPCEDVHSILRQKKVPWYRLFDPKEGETYDPFWAEDDRRRIEKFYESRGFYNARVEAPDLKVKRGGRFVTITYNIEEGEPVLVSSVIVIFRDGLTDEKDPPRMRERTMFKPGDRFELEPYQESADAMKNYFMDEGYYRADVSRQAIVDPDELTAKVTYRIRRGKRYKIWDIHVEGVEKTEEKVVRRAIDLEERDWYSRKEVFRNQRRIQRMPIYKIVRLIEEPDDENNRLDVTFSVQEGKPREVRVGAGYGTEEGVRVQAGWRHVNFLGDAREFEVFARWSMLLEREEVTIRQPNVIKPGDYFELKGERRVENEEAYTYEAISLSPLYHMILTDYLWAEAGYRIEYSQTSSVIDLTQVEEDDLAREGLLSALSGRLEWADVDSQIDPTRGAKASLYSEYGGGFLGGRFEFTKTWGEFNAYYPFGPVVGALKWKLGYAEPLGDLQRMPVFLRFYTGGTGMVRGYTRYSVGPEDNDGDPIGGTKLWEGSIELRFPIYKDLSGVVFEDSGWVWLEEEDYDPDDVAHGYGFGFRYQTPIGPVALDFGWPIEDGADISDVRFHFNVGHTF